MSSDYEKLREANVKRNEEIMKMLGLDAEDFRLHGMAEGEKKGKAAGGGGKRKKAGGGGDDDERSTPRKRGGAKVSEPARRSSRQQGIKAEFGPDDLNPEEEDREERERLLRNMRASLEDHAEAESEYVRWAGRWSGRQEKQTIVGTASYAHTLMRVRTMSHEALARRIAVIERAKGRHAVVKMKLFAQILCLERYEDLSADATEAYKRLVDVLGEAKEDEDEGAEADE